MTVRSINTLLAIKVINLAPGLRQSDRQVGVTLIEHFNRRTGRCDPGLDRIAKLLGYCTRTIIRATQRLERVGLFHKTRHGGHANCNSYEPNWSRFAEFESIWNDQLRTMSCSRRTGLSPDTGQPSHFPRDSGVTQTCPTNLQKVTCSKKLPREASGSNRQVVVPRWSSRPISRASDAAHAAAERRWTDALHEQFARTPITYGEVIAAIDEPMQAAATDAEMRSRGAGFDLILKQLKLNKAKR